MATDDFTVQFHFGVITLQVRGDGSIWLEGDGGEAMEVGRVEIDKLLKQYYEENF